MNLTFSDAEGPLKEADYLLAYPGGEENDKTDGSGTIKASIPVTVQQVRITLSPPDQEPLTYHVNMREIDPTEEVSGIQSRLSNLGYYDGKIDDDFGDVTFGAIADFQEDQGLKITNQLDADTLTALTKLHE